MNISGVDFMSFTDGSFGQVLGQYKDYSEKLLGR